MRARDAAGNVDGTPASRSWTVDTVAPETSLASSGPSGPNASPNASFAFSSSESGGSFECRLDGGDWVGCSSPQAYSGLPQGARTFEVRARDAAGNVDGTPASRAWTVDTVAPDTTITAGPSGPITTATATFSFTASESPATFQCRVDTASFAACQSPFATGALANGPHTFEVRALDAALNLDATPAQRSFRVCTGAGSAVAVFIYRLLLPFSPALAEQQLAALCN